METQQVPTDPPYEFSDDLLRGADEIAKFLFGENADRRKIYYLCERTNFPAFRLGSMLCARKSVLLKWISDQENRTKPPQQ